MHGLVAQNALCVGVRLNVVELDSDYLLRGDAFKHGQVDGLICADVVPGVKNELCIVAAGGLDDCPGLFHIGQAAVGHGLHADGVLAGAVAELFELLRRPLNGVVLHQAAVDVVYAEKLAHVEAHLLLVLLLIGAVGLGPLYDVLHLSDLYIVLGKDGKDVLVKKSLVQGVYIGLGAKADAIKACGLGGGYALFKAALVAQRPRADGNGVFLRHVLFPPVFVLYRLN